MAHSTCRFHGLSNGIGKLCSGFEQVTGSAAFLTGMLDAPFAVSLCGASKKKT